jgi:pimeloyl-ACP methyl ester carboxylesterase
MRTTLRHVRLPSGLTIECAEQGPRGGPALLLHGITDTIEAPVLLPWGDADAFSPESDQKRLEWQLPRATRAVYAGVGHALHWEQPRRFAADLIRFEEALADAEVSRGATV